MRIEGFRHIDLLRCPSDQEVKFATIIWFDDLAASPIRQPRTATNANSR